MKSKDKVVGHFGQELKVGDTIAMVAKSGSCYMLVCKIHSIEPDESISWGPKFKVKVTYKKEDKRWHYKDGKYHYVNHGIKNQISRVYNWESAITLMEAE